MAEWRYSEPLPRSKNWGLNIIKRAAEDPLRRIAINAGVEGSIALQKVKEGKGAFGFNAASEEFEDLMKAGIIDPTKVVRTALQNAASIAGMMLTTEAMVASDASRRRNGRYGWHGRYGRQDVRQ